MLILKIMDGVEKLQCHNLGISSNNVSESGKERQK